MNILIIHNYYNERGGEDAVFENEAKALEKLGHTVIKYTQNNKDIYKYNILQKIFFLFSSIYSIKTINDIKAILKSKEIDIAHVHNVFPIITPVIYRILKKNNIKVVQTIHNYRFICPNGLFYVRNKNCRLCEKGNVLHCIKNICYKKSLKFSILYALIVWLNRNNFKKNIDAYICLTEFSKNILADAKYEKSKLFIKDNAYIDTNIKREKSEGYYLYLGRISSEKGVEFLLQSFTRLTQYKLIIAGIGPDLEKLKAKYNSPNIEYKGFLNGINKRNLIKKSIAVIVPSLWYENYPMTIVEAFSSGIPVIASNIGGIPYIIEDSKNGLLFEPGNFDQLADKLNKLNKNQILRERLGNIARITFLHRMEMNKNIKKLEDIYQELLNAN